jgi:hypothetical protein
MARAESVKIGRKKTISTSLFICIIKRCFLPEL